MDQFGDGSAGRCDQISQGVGQGVDGIGANIADEPVAHRPDVARMAEISPIPHAGIAVARQERL